MNIRPQVIVLDGVNGPAACVFVGRSNRRNQDHREIIALCINPEALPSELELDVTVEYMLLLKSFELAADENETVFVSESNRSFAKDSDNGPRELYHLVSVRH
ncbi:MAG: hypothetical protein ACYDB2_01650 [Acidimicrobiales bacterium]